MLASREPCAITATDNSSKQEAATTLLPAQYLSKYFMIGPVPQTLLLQ